MRQPEANTNRKHVHDLVHPCQVRYRNAGLISRTRPYRPDAKTSAGGYVRSGAWRANFGLRPAMHQLQVLERPRRGRMLINKS